MSYDDQTLAAISSEQLRREFEALPELLQQSDLYRLSQVIRTTADYSQREMSAFLGDDRVPAQWRFGAMYCLLVRARHLRNFAEFRDIVRENIARFSKQPAMLAMVAEADAFYAFTAREKKSVLDKCRSALKRFDGVGLKLLAAEILLEVAQAETASEQDPLMIEAESYVADALAEYPRSPRYLAVMAQILARRGRFADARAFITDAMSIEDSTHSQYSIRIARYESVRSEIMLRESAYTLSSRLEGAIRDFDDTRGSLIQLVGLLAAVLALVIVGTQLAISVPAAQGAGMLMIVGGVLLLSFVGYSLLLGRAPTPLRILATLVLALSLMAAGSLFILKVEPSHNQTKHALPPSPASPERAAGPR
ncbi:MAG TPA: hypothetical protein VN380_10265 [Thermoanaerobaculia bacterium]|jgi:hypothetical protein|nr:hypothetical protein [Thermoanaerobaculia bacterium]